MNRQFRQGDVLLIAVETIPHVTAAPRQQGRVVLAEGEVTGHAHAFGSKAVRMLREERSGRVFVTIRQTGVESSVEE